MTFDVERHRADFPSLQRLIGGKPAAYLDGPGGTQVPRSVMTAMNHYYETCNANTHGQSVTSIETDACLDQARETMAAFLGALSPSCISFGANMTSLAFPLSRGLARLMQPGDEVVITDLDHEANRSPWQTLAEHGAVVHSVKMTAEGRIDMDELRAAINPKTKIVAVGGSSNALGTANDLMTIRQWSRAVGAWLIIDAVHYAPHFPIDVAKLDPDFLLCSAYKFYGPHVGILYSRPGLLTQVPTDKVRPQYAEGPFRIETGTLNHAAICGVTAAAEYIASAGQGETLYDRIHSGIAAIHSHEMGLARRLYDGLTSIPEVKVYGLPVGTELRAPTISFRVQNLTPQEVAQFLGEHGLCVSCGSFYADRVTETLGLHDTGGFVRIGISLYNTVGEVDRVIDCLKALIGRNA